MNKRIQELAEKAGMRTVCYEQDEDIHFTEALNVEQFARLLIQECATVILNNDIEKAEYYDVNSPYFIGWERGVIDSARIMQDHFE